MKLIFGLGSSLQHIANYLCYLNTTKAVEGSKPICFISRCPKSSKSTVTNNVRIYWRRLKDHWSKARLYLVKNGPIFKIERPEQLRISQENHW